MSNNHVASWNALGNGASPYQIAGIGDYNGDGTSDVLWRNANTGDVGDWTVTNNHVTGWNQLGNGGAHGRSSIADAKAKGWDNAHQEINPPVQRHRRELA